MTTNVIKNSEIITNALNDCIKLIEQNRSSISNADDFEVKFKSYLNQEYLSLESIRCIKEFWNKNSNSGLFVFHFTFKIIVFYKLHFI
jgi:hypothetical protein